MPGHDVAAIEVIAGGYVLRCSCGWESARLTRTTLLEEWERHRVAVPAEQDS